MNTTPSPPSEELDGDEIPSHSQAPTVGPMRTADEQLELLHRQSVLDGDDVIADVVVDLITESLQQGDATFVARRLTKYAAHALTDQLFTMVSACLPSSMGSPDQPIQPAAAELPTVRVGEDPPLCEIDAACRHEIRTKDPPSPSRHPTAAASPPSTPKSKTKRFLAGLSAASSLFASSSSPSRPASVASSFTRASKKAAPPPSSYTSTGPVPGVPYSTATSDPSSSPLTTISPRKAIAHLKSVACAAPAQTSPGIDTANDIASTDPMECEAGQGQPTISRTPSGRAKAGDTTRTAWALILPNDSTKLTHDGHNSPSTVHVEYSLPRRQDGGNGGSGLPDLGRRSSRKATATGHYPISSHERSNHHGGHASSFLPSADEEDAVEIDVLGMVGYDLRSRLSLAAGVKLQSETGGLLQAGPELPLFPTKMRRSTFLGGSQELILAEPTAASISSPTRPSGRPSTTIGISRNNSGSANNNSNSPTPASTTSSGVFSLTECAAPPVVKIDATQPCSRTPSALSLSPSRTSTAASSTTGSLKNLFRKPSRVARPCTTSSSGCSGHNHQHHHDAGAFTTPSSTATTTSTLPTATEPPTDEYAELIKQRALQRKPSFFSAAPSKKKQQANRSSLSPVATSEAALAPSSPLSRRSLSTNNSSPAHCTHRGDPLHHATKLF